MILYKEEVDGKVNKQSVSGLILMGNYTEQPTKNGSTYLGGSLDAMGVIPFKVWQGKCFNKMKEIECNGKICRISAEVNEYGGTKQLILDDIEVMDDAFLEEHDIKKADFIVSKYNIESYWNLLVSTLSKNVTPNALEVFNLVMDVETTERFKEEYAAVNYHDNCKGGLLAHTTKVVKLASFIKMYPYVLERVSPDLLFLGCALHDIGKILEYNMGVTSKEGKILSHNTMGVYMLEKHKDKIISLKGIEFYYDLLSVIAQHHGEFGDKPRTVASFIVHQLDCLDSTLSLLNQTLEVSSGQISFDGMKLS